MCHQVTLDFIRLRMQTRNGSLTSLITESGLKNCCRRPIRKFVVSFSIT
jgi:hypothetical protein